MRLNVAIANAVTGRMGNFANAPKTEYEIAYTQGFLVALSMLATDTKHEVLWTRIQDELARVAEHDEIP